MLAWLVHEQVAEAHRKTSIPLSHPLTCTAKAHLFALAHMFAKWRGAPLAQSPLPAFRSDKQGVGLTASSGSTQVLSDGAAHGPLCAGLRLGPGMPEAVPGFACGLDVIQPVGESLLLLRCQRAPHRLQPITSAEHDPDDTRRREAPSAALFGGAR
jgi:hypothetical protein